VPSNSSTDPNPVDCGPPTAPQNGSLESYTNTTDGSVVFYSCDPGLVPVGRMMTVCTGTGWSPSPDALSCSVGMLQLTVKYVHGELMCIFL